MELLGGKKKFKHQYAHHTYVYTQCFFWIYQTYIGMRKIAQMTLKKITKYSLGHTKTYEPRGGVP